MKIVVTGANGKIGKAAVRAISNSGWETARKRAGLSQVRVHDLKHTDVGHFSARRYAEIAVVFMDIDCSNAMYHRG